MRLSDFDFPFDTTLVATRPVSPRNRAHLLLLDRATQQYIYRQVTDLSDLLRPGALLELNDTRVLGSRLAWTNERLGNQ